MEKQLHLLDVDSGSHYRLDEHTKETGRRGIARARAALQAAVRANVGLDAEAEPVDLSAFGPATTTRRPSARHRPATAQPERPADAA